MFSSSVSSHNSSVMALVKVAIDALQLGSYVIAVTRQQGDVVVKHAGWVRTDAALANLIRSGVIEVQIDTDKQLPPPKELPAAAPVTTIEKPRLRRPFSQELQGATLALQATSQHAAVDLAHLAAQQTVDLSTLTKDSQRLYQSCRRNHQALLYLQQVASEDNSLLQHSISCACLMAAFCAELAVTEAQARDYTLAALLHEVGAFQLQLQFPAEQISDLQASHYSVPLLQQAGCAEQVVSTVAEHCLAEPPSEGGKMLAIVNYYCKLMAAGSTMSSLQSAAELKKQAGHTLDLRLVGVLLRCVGLYSPGTVVRLKSGRIALVLENHPRHADKPKVKVFYHSVHRHHLPTKVLDLQQQTDDAIVACADLRQYQLELQHYL